MELIDCLWLAQIPKHPEMANVVPNVSLSISVPVKVFACISVNFVNSLKLTNMYCTIRVTKQIRIWITPHIAMLDVCFLKQRLCFEEWSISNQQFAKYLDNKNSLEISLNFSLNFKWNHFLHKTKKKHNNFKINALHNIAFKC